MSEHRLVTRLRELVALGLTGEEAITVHFGLAAAYVPGVVAEVEGPGRTAEGQGHDAPPAVLAVGDTRAQARLRSELARVFESTGTKSLEELSAYLEQES